MTDRESRIRALAAQRMCRWDYFGKDDPWIRQSAERNLSEAALIIDAIDALPVPGEEPLRGAAFCAKHGHTRARAGSRCMTCGDKPGTGKASE